MSGRIETVAMAAAQDFNAELMVLCNALGATVRALPVGHAAIEPLAWALASAQRVAWSNDGLLEFLAAQGVKAHAKPLKEVLSEAKTEGQTAA